MRLLRFPLIIFIAFILGSLQVKAQGCSDAGICTLENIKPGSGHADTHNQFSVGLGYGNADNAISVITPYISYSRKINNFVFEGRLTSINQSGDEASVYGLSDLFMVMNYNVKDNLTTTLGLKIPLTSANRKLDGLPLPMDYQSSLGTVDLLLGLAYRISKLQLSAAWQQPLSQNSNTFLVDDYPVDSDFRSFQSTNNYLRKGDIILRLSYPIQVSKAFVVTPSLLPIYHLGEDRFTDISSQEQVITGSDGLTFNVNLYLDIAVGEKANLQFNVGAPLVVREARPDGLTRSFVANLEYQIKF